MSNSTDVQRSKSIPRNKNTGSERIYIFVILLNINYPPYGNSTHEDSNQQCVRANFLTGDTSPYNQTFRFLPIWQVQNNDILV